MVFTNDARTVKPGVISEEIIVQTQNDSAVAEKVDETNDVTFTSTSATGEFLSGTGNAVSKTMIFALQKSYRKIFNSVAVIKFAIRQEYFL